MGLRYSALNQVYGSCSIFSQFLTYVILFLKTVYIERYSSFFLLICVKEKMKTFKQVKIFIKKFFTYFLIYKEPSRHCSVYYGMVVKWTPVCRSTSDNISSFIYVSLCLNSFFD